MYPFLYSFPPSICLSIRPSFYSNLSLFRQQEVVHRHNMASTPQEAIFLHCNACHASSGNAYDERYNACAADSDQFEPVSTCALAASLNWSFLSLGILIIATAAGNLMVCAAVFHERSLQNMPNYFLTSLAVADFLVSVFIMPPGLVVLVFG